jgi:hypothetical protein
MPIQEEQPSKSLSAGLENAPEDWTRERSGSTDLNLWTFTER